MRCWLRPVRSYQIHLRTTVVAIAVVALLTVASSRWIPEILWRVRLERIISSKVEGDGPADSEVWSNPSFQFYNALTGPELEDARRDPIRVVDRLIEAIAAADRPEFRRERVLRSLEIYLTETNRKDMSRRFISRGVELVSSGKLPGRLEWNLAFAIATRSQAVGIEDADRTAVRERARSILSSKLPHPDYAKVWCCVLAFLGGPEEKKIILDAWDRLDDNGRSKMVEFGVSKQ